MIIVIVLLYSCTNTGAQKDTNTKVVHNKIIQQADGTISLKVDKADWLSGRSKSFK